MGRMLRQETGGCNRSGGGQADLGSVGRQQC